MNDNFGIIAAIIFMAGIAFGFWGGRKDVRHDALRNDVGQYNSKTGSFEWKTNFVYITNFSIEKK
jgi:hypothetical protein